MKMIILGPPNSGKGTYAQRLSPTLNIPHISTGDLFRENIKNQTELGKKIKEIIDAGNLAPDNLTVEMLKERISRPDCEKGFILDGFPRTIPQAEALDKITKIDVVINMVVPDDVLIGRAVARVSCRKCAKIYNTLYLKPKQEGVCDECGGELYQRKDDTEEVARERLEVFKNQTAPLIDYYKEKGILRDVENRDINTPPEPIVEKILEVLKKFEV